MITGKTTLRLAAADDLTPKMRAKIREALAPLLDQLGAEVSLAVAALDGPDPEFALSLLVDIVTELPGSLRALEGALAGHRHLRVAA